jgi:hypothetical protein
MTRPTAFLGLLVLVLASCPAVSQETRKADAGLAVSVPTFHNELCPIMKKPVVTTQFAETANGRIYVCCKGCIKKIQADVPAAYKAAYATPKKLENKTCPVSGDEIGDSAVSVSLQGHDFKVCCQGCVSTATENGLIILAKLTNPKLSDVGNSTCPMSGKPVAANTFAIVGDYVVRLASADAVEQVRKDPKKALDKAREIKAASGKKGATGKAGGEGGCCAGKEKGDEGCCEGGKKGEPETPKR